MKEELFEKVESLTESLLDKGMTTDSPMLLRAQAEMYDKVQGNYIKEMHENVTYDIAELDHQIKQKQVENDEAKIRVEREKIGVDKDRLEIEKARNSIENDKLAIEELKAENDHEIKQKQLENEAAKIGVDKDRLEIERVHNSIENEKIAVEKLKVENDREKIELEKVRFEFEKEIERNRIDIEAYRAENERLKLYADKNKAEKEMKTELFKMGADLGMKVGGIAVAGIFVNILVKTFLVSETEGLCMSSVTGKLATEALAKPILSFITKVV